MAAREHAFIEEMMTNKQGGMTLKQERDHWKRETQLLQLEILRLKGFDKTPTGREMNVMSARPQLAGQAYLGHSSTWSNANIAA